MKKKLKKIVDKLIKENIDFDVKEDLIVNIFRQQPTCLRCVDYEIFKKYNGSNKDKLLGAMLTASEFGISTTDNQEFKRTPRSIKEFYENFVSDSLKKCDDPYFAGYLLDNNFTSAEIEKSIFENPNFVKKPSIIKKHWENIKSNYSKPESGKLIDIDGAVDTFVQYIANISDQKTLVNEVVGFIGMNGVDFSNDNHCDILSVLDKKKLKKVKQDPKIISALVEKSVSENSGFSESDFLKFEKFISDNKKTFNQYLEGISKQSDNKKTFDKYLGKASNQSELKGISKNLERETFVDCISAMNKEQVKKIYGHMNAENANKFSIDIVKTVPTLYENKNFVKTEENSIVFVKSIVKSIDDLDKISDTLNKIPKKLRTDHVAEEIAKYYVDKLGEKWFKERSEGKTKPDEYLQLDKGLSKIIEEMQAFNKNCTSNGSFLIKNSSIEHRREFFAKLDKGYLSKNIEGIIKNNPACLFVKRNGNYEFLVKQSNKKQLEDLSIKALNYALAPDNPTGIKQHKDFVKYLPKEILSNTEVINKMISLCRYWGKKNNKEYVSDFFASLDFENKNVKDNIVEMMNLAVSTNPHVLAVVKKGAPKLYENVMMTKSGKKLMYKAIMVDPKVIVEEGKEAEIISQFKTKQRFAIAQACISKLASAQHDKVYEDMLETIFVLDDNDLSKGQVKKLVNQLAKNNPDKFVDMYMANMLSQYKNPHISKILDTNFAQHKDTFGKRLEERYNDVVTKYEQSYNQFKVQRVLQTKQQISILQDKIETNSKMIENIKNLKECKRKQAIINRIEELGLDETEKQSVQKIIGENNKISVIKTKLETYFDSKMQKCEKQNQKYNDKIKSFEGVVSALDPDGKLKDIQKGYVWTKEDFEIMSGPLKEKENNLNNFNTVIEKHNICEVKSPQATSTLTTDIQVVDDKYFEEVEKEVEKEIEETKKKEEKTNAEVEKTEEENKENVEKLVGEINEQFSDKELEDKVKGIKKGNLEANKNQNQGKKSYNSDLGLTQ